jgi:glycosyltransferase involved in cell wall biosynthesis
MRLLIVFPSALFPITGMSQVRSVNQLKRLAQDYKIIFTDIVSKPSQETECREQLKDFVSLYKPVYSDSYNRNKLYRSVRFILHRVAHLISAKSYEELSLGNAVIRKQFSAYLRETAFEAILIHYWNLGFLFEMLPERVLKMIDTHYLVEENLELLPKYRQKYLSRLHLKRELEHSICLQHKHFSESDLIIVNSKRQAYILASLHPEYNVSLTVNGQDLDELICYRTEVDKNAILFYGALSNQFNRLALQRVMERIFPVLHKKNPALRLYVVGSNPPEDIISKFITRSITVTGYLHDIRPVVSSCSLMLLPLETGSGFRGRIVEVMALGVPVIGTSNALQSIGIENGKQGYLAETDDDIIEKAQYILGNMTVRRAMSEECRKFAIDNFSIETTFGKLAGEIAATAEMKAMDVRY